MCPSWKSNSDLHYMNGIVNRVKPPRVTTFTDYPDVDGGGIGCGSGCRSGDDGDDGDDDNGASSGGDDLRRRRREQKSHQNNQHSRGVFCTIFAKMHKKWAG